MVILWQGFGVKDKEDTVDCVIHIQGDLKFKKVHIVSERVYHSALCI